MQHHKRYPTNRILLSVKYEASFIKIANCKIQTILTPESYVLVKDYKPHGHRDI